MRVGLPQGGAAIEFDGTGAGDGQHLLAEVDAGERDVLGVGREIEAGADRYLEHLAPGLRASPRSGVAEQHAVHQLHLPVIGTGMLVPVTMPPLAAVTQLRAYRHSLRCGESASKPTLWGGVNELRLIEQAEPGTVRLPARHLRAGARTVLWRRGTQRDFSAD